MQIAATTTELAGSLDERLRTLSRVVRHSVDYGLSLTAVTVLARRRESGPQRITDLAALEHVAQPTMTTIVGRLEARGFVERRRDDADRRAVMVALTAQGARRLAEVGAARTEFLAGHMSALDGEQLASLAAALPVLDHIIESATT